MVPIYCVSVQGSRNWTCTSAVPPTNISQQQIPSTATKQHSKLRELSRCRKKNSYIVTLSRDLNPNINSHCHLAEAKQASIHATKKTNFFIHAKCPNKATTHANTTECSLVLILSYSNVYVRVQALSKHVHSTLTTSYDSG